MILIHFMTLQVFELDGGIFYELNGGFQKEALERLVDYAYTAQLDVPGHEVKLTYIHNVYVAVVNALNSCL